MSGRKDTILVVDDDAFSRLQLAHGLEQQGYATMLAENGQQALELLRGHAFDLILLDIVMPEIDGFEVLRRLQNDSALRDIPVVVISALEEMDSVVTCIKMGAEDYLPKPFDPTLLQARIGASLEKKHLREAIVSQFGKYVPESIASAIVQGQGNLEPARTIATVLYSDIEGFTTISEGMAPEKVFAMLNEYFPAIVGPITRNQGVVNQFLGDALLATFNVPLENPRHADCAISAAMEIQAMLKEKKFAGVSLRTRIGINTGEVIAGNVGSRKRHNYTVLGDTVNLAARLEQLNKQYQTLVLVSAATTDLLSEPRLLVPIGDVPIRGKREPVNIFELKL